MRSFLTLCLLVLSFSSIGQEMRIGLFRSVSVSSVLVELHQGGYTIYGDTMDTPLSLTSATISVSGGRVKVSSANGELTAREVRIVQDTANCAFKMKGVSISTRQHFYRNNLEITAKGKYLTLVNLVDMDNYLAGVVESEGGGGRHIEYYKVQALMSRTYALKNKGRHKKDGFHLCDGVHCQAYHHMVRHTPSIMVAVKATKGKVLVDARNRLVTSYFSANCGGQICDASHVWNNSVPYVESFVDTFCIHTRQATWVKKIAKHQWDDYLRKEFGVTYGEVGELLYNFKQEERKAFYIHPSLGVPLRDLRKKFKLKSTFFSTHLEGNFVVLEGRGFGHGVGLCQEGAMNMAKAGYDFTQIARFYFSDVHVVDYFRDQFFEQTGEEINQ